MRKIVQFRLASEKINGGTPVLALCNDGTMWMLSGLAGDGWQRLPEIPQPTDAKEKLCWQWGVDT